MLILATQPRSERPQGIELISKLESIQRRATKFTLCLPFLTNISYKERIMSVNLLPVCYWHELLDLGYFYKATHNMIHLDLSVVPFVLFYISDHRIFLTHHDITKNSAIQSI